MKYDSDEPHKQGSAADRVDFISHIPTAQVDFGQGLLCELGVVASYFDDDAVVSVIGLIFNGIAGPWYNISIFCYLLV